MNLLKYNIRVYGILINDNLQVLLSKESRFDSSFTKFPGGGHQLGEGLEDGLKREFREELGVSIELKDHFYTTDFFQTSAFNDQEQLISIYYLVKSSEIDQIANGMEAIDKLENVEHSFQWKNISDLKKQDLTYPIDQLVAEMLIENF